MNSIPVDDLEVGLMAHAQPVEPNYVGFEEETHFSSRLAFPCATPKHSVQNILYSSIVKGLASFVDSAEAEVRASEEQRQRDHMMCQLVIAQQQRVTKEAERLTSPASKEDFRTLKEEMKRTGMVTNSGHRALISDLLHDRTQAQQVSISAGLSSVGTEKKERGRSPRRSTELKLTRESSWDLV